MSLLYWKIERWKKSGMVKTASVFVYKTSRLASEGYMRRTVVAICIYVSSSPPLLTSEVTLQKETRAK